VIQCVVLPCEFSSRIVLSIDVPLSEKEILEHHGDSLNRENHNAGRFALLEINMTKMYLSVKTIKAARV